MTKLYARTFAIVAEDVERDKVGGRACQGSTRSAVGWQTVDALAEVKCCPADAS